MTPTRPTQRPGIARPALKRALHGGLACLPPRLRLSADMALGNVAETLAHWRMPAFRVCGRSIDGKNDATLVYLGDLPQYTTWIARFFSAARPAEPIGSHTLAEIRARRGRLADADVLLCPTTPLARRFFSDRDWLCVPKYVRCLVDLDRPDEQLLNRHAVKDDLRIVRKKGYRFAVLRDDASFDEFYESMLLPTVKLRHEERAHISSRDALRALFHRGHLLAAFCDGQWVGANLLVPVTDDTLSWANIGWRDGSKKLMKDRLVSALLYEMIRRARSAGFSTLDLGSCSPFVDDGPLNYKLKWGARMELPQIGYDHGQLQGLNAYFCVRFDLAASQAARSLLQASPLLAQSRERLCAVGWDSTVNAAFRHQIDAGLPWIDLAPSGRQGERR